MVESLPSTAGAAGSIPGRGAKISHASQPKNQNIKQKQYCNKFNKDLKKWSTSDAKKKRVKRFTSNLDSSSQLNIQNLCILSQTQT